VRLPKAPPGAIVDARPRLFVMTPAYRNQVDSGLIGAHVRLVARTLTGGPVRYLGFSAWDGSSVEWSRNKLLADALRSQADWGLFVDADTVWEDATAVERMILDGERRRAAVVAAPVRLRGRGGYNARRVQAPQLLDLPESEFRGRLVEADAVGTAFMAINLAWVREHWPEQPWFLFHQLPGPQPTKLGEDITFCLRVRELGGTVLADGRLEPRHVGAAYPPGHPYSEEPDRTAPPPWAPAD
jgi:hypothetical protein